MNSDAVVMADTIQWQDTDPGVKRKILGYDEELMMVCVEFEKGAVGSLHKHPHRQVTFVARGTFEITVGTTKRTIKQGDSFFVRSNIEHGVVALDAGTLVDVFTPAREEFLRTE